MPGDLVIEDQGLTKPATVLVEKISDAVGGIAKPYQIVRVAKAEAKADRIRTESEIQLEDLRLRAASRFVEEETRKQLNMENITGRALPHVTADASPQDMKVDWITNFFDKSRLVADEEMQELWAHVLAGEANTPGTFSRKTINTLSDMEKRDAELFRSLCRFLWTMGGESNVVIFPSEEIFLRNDVLFEDISDIESLGLVRLSPEGLFFREESGSKRIEAQYFSHRAEVVLRIGAESDYVLDSGQVLLTGAGRQLASICSTTPVEGMFEYICSKWEHDQRVESVRAV